MTTRVSTYCCSFGDAGVGQPHAVAALEVERLGDDADGQNAPFPRAFGDDRTGASGSSAAAHAGGDEDQTGFVEVLTDLHVWIFGSRHPDFGVGPAPRPWVTWTPSWTRLSVLEKRELLGVGVGDFEFDALETRLDHAVDGVTPGAPPTPKTTILGLSSFVYGAKKP